MGTRSYSSARYQFNTMLRVVSGLIEVLAGLGMALTAAGSITTEREEDTWISLLTTDLTPVEILRAKFLGALWSQRVLLVVMLGLWVLGLLLGALHPVGFLFGLIEMTVFSWFFIALGVRLSLTARSTMRAAGATIALLVLVNGGYLLLGLPILYFVDSPLAVCGCTPFLLGACLLRPGEWSAGNLPHDAYADMIATSMFGVFLYATAAALLTAALVHRFDEWIDRPRRPLFDSIAMKPKTGASQVEVREL